MAHRPALPRCSPRLHSAGLPPSPRNLRRFCTDPDLPGPDRRHDGHGHRILAATAPNCGRSALPPPVPAIAEHRAFQCGSICESMTPRPKETPSSSKVFSHFLISKRQKRLNHNPYTDANNNGLSSLSFSYEAIRKHFVIITFSKISELHVFERNFCFGR
nr:hypothetical protein fge_3_PS127F06_c1_8926 [Paspalum simplex]